MHRILSVFIFVVVLVGCQNRSETNVDIHGETTIFSGDAMTMHYRIIVGKVLDNTQLHAVSTLIEETFQEVNDIYNKWNPKSELSRLNRLPAKTKVVISPELESILEKTDLIVRLSEGRFDPTIEPLQALWKKALVNQIVPSKEEIAVVAPTIGWDLIHFDGGVFEKDHSLTQLDLGGIAKGLAIDIMLERLQEMGYRDLFVEWGGEIRASGQHPRQPTMDGFHQ